MKLEPEEAEELEEKLHQYEGMAHLRVKTWGQSLVIYNGNPKEPEKHARLTNLGIDAWGISLPSHTGRWEKIPLTGTMEEITESLVSSFGVYLKKH